MDAKQWVQHMSGQGKKYPIRHPNKWKSTYEAEEDEESSGEFVFLPKSEYRLCDSPEVWEEVKCAAIAIRAMPNSFIFKDDSGNELAAGEIRPYYDDYRVKSLVIEKLVIEKKVS